MKVTVRVGDVHLTVTDLQLTRAQVRRLLMDCAGIAAAMQPEAEAANPVGFSSHVERAPEPKSESYFTDDED